MDVLERILNVLVPQQALHANGVFGFRVFHRGFPVTESSQANQVNPWVSQPSCDALPLLTMVPRKMASSTVNRARMNRARLLRASYV